MQDDEASFTSFPVDGFRERSDPKLLSNFYTRFKSFTSAASSAVTNVLPVGHTGGRGVATIDIKHPNSTAHDDMVLSSSPFTGARLNAAARAEQQFESPLKYLQDDSSSIAGGTINNSIMNSPSPMHKASPSLGEITVHDDADVHTILASTTTGSDPPPPRQLPQLSRTPSVNTAYSYYNIRDHLPGFAMERETSSDSESIISTRDYIINNIDPRLARSGGLGKEFWMKDENATECFKCSKSFTTWRRKHHCRICGQIFCSSCTELIPGEKFNYPGKMRACVNCLDVIDKYTSPSSEESVNGDSQTINEPRHEGADKIEISFNSAPQPAPAMSIPATRKGESLEIFPNAEISGSPRSVGSKSNIRASFADPVESRDSMAAGTETESEQEEEEEDEKTMSLYTALIGDYENPGNNRQSFFRPRSGTSRSQDGRGLMRLPTRRESFSNVRRLMSSRSRNGLKDSTSNVAPISQRKSRSSNVVPAPSVDLNKACITHARAFLHQLLENYELSSERWVDVLMGPLLACSQKIDLDIRGGDNIDIRHYVKLKRIPGGHPRDITYVDGIVFSKTLALKSMPRQIDNPRILLVTFPLEYSRSGHHFMSIDPVLAQESEYLKKLVRRIVALDPQIVLVSERVSGVALQLLERARIAVVSNVKDSIITRVARYTRADIISSIDRLAMSPRLGKCQSFELRAYKLGDSYKSYIFLRGIPEELGCTILLRGADMMTLANIKAVVEFMVYVVFSLKLETSLMRDEFVLVPSTDPATGIGRDHQDETGYFHDLVRKQQGKIMSSSPFVRFGNPYLLQEARELEDQLVLMERENLALDFDDEKMVVDSYAKLGLKHGIESLPGGVATATELVKAVNGERLQQLRDQWETQKRQWELTYAQAPLMFSPSAHQYIVTLFSLVNKETTAPCIGPEPMAVDFYSDSDMTLGQFIEQACLTSNDACPDGCGKTWMQHYRSYVNGRGRLNVVVENFECRLPGLQNTILMWSYCKECQNTMPVLPMSGHTWKYSFGKYLELSFWSDKISFRAGMCKHDIYRDHVRYFGFHDLAVRFEYDTVELLEVIVPRPRISWKPEREVEIKLEIYISISGKIQRFYSSVRSRLESVIVENVASDRIDDCREKTDQLKAQCEKEQAESLEMLKNVYTETKINEILPLNGIIRMVQENVVNWDAEFADYESSFFPSEKDITRITAQQLRKIFIDKDEHEQEESKSGTATPAPHNTNNNTAATTPTGAATTPAAADDDDGSSDNEKTAISPESSLELQKSTSSLPVDIPGTNTEELLSSEKSLRDAAVDTIKEEDGDKFIEDEQDKVSDLRRLVVNERPNRHDATSAPVSRSASPTKKDVSPKVREVANIFEPPPAVARTSEEIRRGAAASAAAAAAAAASKNKANRPSSIPTLVNRPTPVHSKSASSKPESTSFRKKFTDKIHYPGHSLRQRFGSSTKELERQLTAAGNIGRGQGMSGESSRKTKVSSLAKHFDQLSLEFEKERARERSLMAQGRVRAIPVARARPIVEVFKNVQDAVKDSNSRFPATTSQAPRRSLEEPRRSLEDRRRRGREQDKDLALPQPKDAKVAEPEVSKISTTPNDSKVTSPAVEVANPVADLPVAPEQTQLKPSALPEDDVPKEPKEKEIKPESRVNSDLSLLMDTKEELPHTVERSSLMQTLTRFWADRSSTGWTPLAYPLNHTEHVFAESDIIVREDEPSSLIAFCLASADYIEKIESTRENNSKEVLESTMLKKTGMHLKYQFQEGSAMLSCKIYYAEQFEAFRKQCNCESNYIQSLARCVKWDSAGGKSGSAFLKTLDDRLVVKELSQSELEAFLKFAPSYFEYMAQAFFHELPTVLAKIFGFYQIQIRNPISGKMMKMDLIVMENLFYNRKMTRIFDLKGSMRNRHVKQTGKANEVLLDENMVEYIYESPLFVREYAKRLLRTSLFNDTLFLAKMNVMDYSLVIGIDEQSKQLVVGIIDFIRTFTWDKKLESWVKERSVLGGSTRALGLEPTVISPKQYKNRFREAMERYVLMVPDCWYTEY